MGDLRIVSPARGRAITIVVNGRACSAVEGETVHAALWAAGIRGLRRTAKTGDPRGIFCGMGVCYDCLVTIDGVPNQRACMTLVEDRMEIRIDE
ncbi:(2Fe-2S)-binding protein [Desulfosarcina sp.]|uniref:(2Fe-2S)-binding protein n=1 Tax=Desulfosarcina sp. TaxID=2027861 RepID=UPI0039711654